MDDDILMMNDLFFLLMIFVAVISIQNDPNLFFRKILFSFDYFLLTNQL